jgi:hypothetical protein
MGSVSVCLKGLLTRLCWLTEVSACTHAATGYVAQARAHASSRAALCFLGDPEAALFAHDFDAAGRIEPQQLARREGEPEAIALELQNAYAASTAPCRAARSAKASAMLAMTRPSAATYLADEEWSIAASELV